ncbi:polysaccharide deacetylase family protein [Frankia sp. Ag45/Mut15]|uniref:Polysaccharide deacetylase family protein n=1 Tax=Frankia umida TaxID=573489 RepID=A0ABT0JVW2_9ACTN|nr:polysaccharide deacetylase family protein [Frankia umida]MCK9875683.1 polysaccharide deacetylase family protein [Frankia umida]
MTRLTVTTSWDDGHRHDTLVADMLRQHGLAGTFYIAPDNVEIAPADRLSATAVRDLSADFEIGSHTLSHPVLTRVPRPRAEREITDSKKVIEDLVGKPVTTFCYPRGMYAPEHVDMVARAGYTYARTVRTLATGIADNPLEAPTSLETGRFARQRMVVDVVRAARVVGSTSLVRTGRWDDIAIALFDRCRATGGVYHLWGHSWVVSDRAEWARLDRVLAHIGGRPEVTYAVNGALGRG